MLLLMYGVFYEIFTNVRCGCGFVLKYNKKEFSSDILLLVMYVCRWLCLCWFRGQRDVLRVPRFLHILYGPAGRVFGVLVYFAVDGMLAFSLRIF